jgi:hypothetical protein
MISFWLFLIAVILAVINIFVRGIRGPRIAATFLTYLIFFNIGVMGLLAFYAHLFMPDETAQRIGWAIGSPFQSEIGMANLSYGVLGVLAMWLRGRFWVATILGYSILLFGAFVVHMMQWAQGDVAPLNVGIFVWFNDLFVPIVLLSLLGYTWVSKGNAELIG